MEEIPNASCRFCKVTFKTEFGKFGGTEIKVCHSTSVNLSCATKNKDFLGLILSEVCRTVGLIIERDDTKFSSRVYNPCARKIKNLGQLYKFFNEAQSREGILTL